MSIDQTLYAKAMQQLSDKVCENQNSYGLEAEIVVKPLSYFKSNLNASINAEEKADRLMTDNKDALSYLLGNEHFIYWNMYAAVGPLESSLPQRENQKLWDILKLVNGSGDVKELFGVDSIEKCETMLLDAMELNTASTEYGNYTTYCKWAEAASLFLEENKLTVWKDNLLLDENTENLVGNFASSMESAASNWKTTSEQLGASAWGKLCKAASEFLDDGTSLTKSTPIPTDDAAKEALTKQLCFLSETTKVAKIVSDIETLMGYSKSIFDLVEKIVQVEAVIRTSSDTASVIADMCSASTDSNVPALRYALEEMASFTNGSLTKEQIISCLIGQTSAKELNQFLTKKLQKLIVEKAGTYGLTIEAAQAIGKLTCSSLFNTDKSMENYYKLNALFELETLLKSKVLSYASSFTSNPTAENARKFIAGYTMLYKLFLEGTDGYKEFIKINYRDGGLNSIWSSVSDADYQRIVTSMDNLKFAIRYNLEHEEQEAMADYYDVMRILDAAAVADAGLQPVTPSISVADSQAYLDQVDQESRLHADVIVTDNYALDADIETYGNIIVTRGSTLNLNGHTLLSHGRMDISGGTVDLNSGTLTVYEDIIQSDGKMYCNKGTLNVAGDYRIQSATVDDAGNVTYDSSSGILWMTNAADKINVSGDFVTQSQFTTYSSAVNYNWGNVLYAGTLTVKGNFSQLGDYASFIASDAHRVVLNGDGARTVTFEYSKCHFNEVVISTNTTLYWKGDFFVRATPHKKVPESPECDIIKLWINR